MKKTLLIFLLGAVSLFAQERLKLMTFNIYHGETLDGKINTDIFAEIINKENPDVVGLQEVDFYTKRSGNIDIVLELGRKTNMVPLFARAMEYDNGEYGVAILSRFTFIKSTVYNVHFEEGYEPRIALAVDLKIGNDTLSFITTHLDYHQYDSLRFLQIKNLVKISKGIKYPLFLLGDLNDTPESRSIKLISSMFDLDNPNLLSFPCPKPERKIDYILKRAKKWKLVNEQVIKTEKASDHCAVIAEFEKID